MLREAIVEGDLRSVKRIINSEDGKLKPSDQESCLCLAVCYGGTDIVQLLLERGFDVNQRDALGITPIYYAVGMNDVEITKKLLQNGAEDIRKYSLLFYAAEKGFKNIVKVLLDFGADVNAKDKWGQTPLHHVILQIPTIFSIIRGYVALDIRDIEKVVVVLLKNGADVNAKCSDGFSPLHCALRLKYSSIVGILINHGADFHSIFKSTTKRHKLPPFLVRLGGRPNSPDAKPRMTSALHFATESNDINSVNVLLASGATVDSVQYDGATPLVVAITCQHAKVMRALIAAGADLEQRNKYGLTPLHVACLSGSTTVLNVLLEAGANVNAVCNKGMVPYQYLLQVIKELDNSFYYRPIFIRSLRMKKILESYLFTMYITEIHLPANHIKVAMDVPRVLEGVSRKDIEEFTKHVFICDNVSLYRVFKEFRDPTYTRNPDVSKGLDEAMVVANAKYPGLGYFAKFLVRSARARVRLIEEGIESFVSLNRQNNKLPTLPLDVVDVIFRLLLDEEIKHFIAVSTCYDTV